MLDVNRIKRELEALGPAPLHARLRSAVQAQILDGTLPPREALPSERILEEELGVSRTTIRQALRALADAGFIRSVVGAGSFVTERRAPSDVADLVGVIVPDRFFYVYYAQIASGIGNRLREAGCRVDMGLHNGEFEHLASVVDGLLEQGVAGLIMSPPDDSRVLPVFEQLKERKVVTVMMARYWDVPGVDFVAADNERIGYEATRYLVDIGHTNIVHLTFAYGSTARGRAGGYVRAMHEAGLAPHIYLSGGPAELGSLADLAPCVDRELGGLWAGLARREITALFCFNDEMAGWAQKELRRLNLNVPRDVSLVGVDDLPFAEYFDAPLTTFALPGEEIGRRAADLMVRRLSGERFPPQHLLVPARFLPRLSTAPPAHPAR